MHIQPFPGWERELPQYRAMRAVHPAAKARFRTETPFSMTVDSDAWQYGTRDHKAGEIIETKEWPHPSFQPVNYSAVKVLEFFNSRQKSRLARSPWYGESIRLDDGLHGTDPKPVAPRPEPVGAPLPARL